MDEKALQTLEFPKIIGRVAGLCAFPISRELALALTPSTRASEVQQRLALTTEARLLLDLQGTFTVGGARDIRQPVKEAARGRTLAPTQLLEILDTIRSARDLRTRFTRVRDYAARFPLLTDLVLTLASFPNLEADIARSISDQGDVLDSASPELGRIRAEARVAEGRVQERLHSLLQRYGSAVQEAIITQRQGRYVIPVRTTERAQVPGIVHDTSASGQTLFVEPLEIVDLTNRWRRLQIEEQHEIDRILAALSQQVAAHEAALSGTLTTVARIDLALAQGRYSIELDGTAPHLPQASGTTDDRGHPSHRLDLRQARHPLLGPAAVPIDLWLGADARILIITGPNTGGKTVALKTVGLLVLMAQTGLHLPVAEGSCLSVFPHVFADIGDEQSIEQSLSTFSSHMSNIVRMFREVGPDSLVLLDELGAGTDPVEGSALARAICTALLERYPLVVATSHYAELKSFAYTTPGVVNASVEFDVETLSPTYRLTIGVPGRSNALAIATRLGLNPAIIEAARALLDQEQVKVEELLAEVRADRERAARELQRAEEIYRQAEQERQALQAERTALEAARAAAVAEAAAAFEAEMAELRASLRQLGQESQNVAVTREWLQQARARVDQVAAEFQAAEAQRRKVQRVAGAGPRLAVGDLVQARSLGQQGQIVELTGESALVQIGAFRTRVPVSDLTRVGRGQARQAGAEDRRPRSTRTTTVPPTDASIEVDVRGMRAHEIDGILDRVINDAVLGNLPMLRIIHGKGTGALRQVVREYLRSSPLVSSLETAPANQGGEGVTLAYFRG